MENGIFQKGLDEELGYLFFLHPFVTFKYHLETVIIAEFLDFHILAQHPEFLPYHYKLIGIGQGAAQELDKGDQHPGRLLILSHVHHALD